MNNLNDSFMINSTDIKCNLCGNCLSISPVFCSHSLGPVCGRCYQDVPADSGDLIHQPMYELLAKNINFPCRYKDLGCESTPKWDFVCAHEEFCVFRNIYCPLIVLNKCSMNVTSKCFEEHINNLHTEFIGNPQIILTDPFTNVIFFTKVGLHLIAVNLKKNCDKIDCVATINDSLLESECYRFQLEMFDELLENSVILRKNRLYPLSHFNNETAALTVDLNQVKMFLNGTFKILGKFGIVRKNKKEVQKIYSQAEETAVTTTPKVPDQNTHFDENLISELECPVCQEYMSPPIYICSSGHSICSTCINKVETCPTCRSQFLKGTRNITLEKLAVLMHVPCKNVDFGCHFVSTAENLRIHQELCQFQSKDCIFKCGWIGVASQIKNHIEDKHKSEIIRNGNRCKYNSDLDKSLNLAMLFKDDVFLVAFKQNRGKKAPLNFILKHYSTIENKPKFRFTFELLDDSQAKRHFSITDLVSPFSDTSIENLGTIIPYNTFKKFMENSCFTYTVTLNRHFN